MTSVRRARRVSRAKNSISSKPRRDQMIAVASVAAHGLMVAHVTSTQTQDDVPYEQSTWYRYSLMVDGVQQRGGIALFWGAVRIMMDALGGIASNRPKRVQFTIENTGREVT